LSDYLALVLRSKEGHPSPTEAKMRLLFTGIAVDEQVAADAEYITHPEIPRYHHILYFSSQMLREDQYWLSCRRRPMISPSTVRRRRAYGSFLASSTEASPTRRTFRCIPSALNLPKYESPQIFAGSRYPEWWALWGGNYFERKGCARSSPSGM